MPIEAANYIHELDPTNPAGGDGVADADNHLRMIKQALKNSFPNVTAPVTLTNAQFNSVVPAGAILMWSGTVATIPSGWALCNGSTYPKADGSGNIISPNLVNRFVLGANADTVAALGGSSAIDIQTEAAGHHAHGGGTSAAGYHAHGGGTVGAVLSWGQMPSHNHSVSAPVFAAGAGQGLYSASFVSIVDGTVATSSAGNNEAHFHSIYGDGEHGHTIWTDGAGSHAHRVYVADTRPPFMALAYIIKL